MDTLQTMWLCVFHHLYYLPFVRSRSQVLPRLKEEGNYIKVWLQGGRVAGDLVRACIPNWQAPLGIKHL